MRLALLVACLFAGQAVAQDQPPVAIRWWGQGMVSVETWWDLAVVIDPYSDGDGYEVPKLSADLIVATHERADHNNAEAMKGDPVLVHCLGEDGLVRELHHYLGRSAGDERTVWRSNEKATSAQQPAHAIYVETISAWRDDSEGREHGATAIVKVLVDDLRIAHMGDLGQRSLTDEQLNKLGAVDVLLLPVGGRTIDGAQAWAIVQQVKPRVVVPIQFQVKNRPSDSESVDKFLTHIPANWQLEEQSHNTLAVVAGRNENPTGGGKVVVLDNEPWQPQGDLSQLLKKMDASCLASQEVFARLSSNQMSWQPPNRTHTPRWNAEHMMGRQLGFFSQIYAAIEPDTFTHIDLNPKQMPEDYVAAHPDWSGAEEARQMQRANAYVHRFAYLLDGIDLDQKAPGSFWTLRRLLKQMDRHFGEHTANVEKKLQMDEWPEE